MPVTDRIRFNGRVLSERDKNMKFMMNGASTIGTRATAATIDGGSARRTSSLFGPNRRQACARQWWMVHTRLPHYEHEPETARGRT